MVLGTTHPHLLQQVQSLLQALILITCVLGFWILRGAPLWIWRSYCISHDRWVPQQVWIQYWLWSRWEAGCRFPVGYIQVLGFNPSSSQTWFSALAVGPASFLAGFSYVLPWMFFYTSCEEVLETSNSCIESARFQLIYLWTIWETQQNHEYTSTTSDLKEKIWASVMFYLMVGTGKVSMLWLSQGVVAMFPWLHVCLCRLSSPSSAHQSSLFGTNRTTRDFGECLRHVSYPECNSPSDRISICVCWSTLGLQQECLFFLTHET